MKRNSAFILFLLLGSLVAGLGANYFIHQGAPKKERVVVEGSSIQVQDKLATTQSSSRALLGDPQIFVELAKKVVPSVVNISTTTRVRRGGPGSQSDLFRKFFEEFFQDPGRPRGQGIPGGPGGRGPGLLPDEEDEEGPHAGPKGEGIDTPYSLGSGFIIESSGLIVTNNHVIDGADKIKIYFTENDEVPTDGELIGKDVELDIALIQVKTKIKLEPLALGDSDSTEVGEYVAAVGNPIGHGHTLTHGIISAKGRNAPNFPLARYLQTDAPINPGNSGGPLVNLRGEVIGINNAIDARGQGIGFAIPINAVKQVIPQLKTKGTVARGYIGVLVNQLTPEIAGQIGAPADLRAPFVAHVYPGEPAEKAGLKPYDVITDIEFNGKNSKITSAQDLILAITAVEVGKSIDVKIRRGKETKTLKVVVSERPAQQPSMGGRPPKKEKSKKEKKTAVDAGMELEDITPPVAQQMGLPGDIKGVVVTSLSYDGAAAKAGLYRGDIILEVNKQAIHSVKEFNKVVNKKATYLMRIRRSAPGGQASYSVLILDLKDEH